MFFGNKNKKERKCEGCGSKSAKDFSFCPHCGNSFLDPREEQDDFGLLGKSDISDFGEVGSLQGFGITDKLINSVFSSLMRNMDRQFRQMDKERGEGEVGGFPGGVRIKISGPFSNNVGVKKKRRNVLENRTINESQARRMSSLPRAKAKSNVKRLGDKVVYELNMPGVDSMEDVFVSKLESGYEVKAIGDKKVYVNSVPINLPLRKYSILKNKLLVEFFGGD